LEGFKSIRNLENLELGRLNILIGSNGSGKSNLISFFRMLRFMAEPPGGFQQYVGIHAGGASGLLFDGPETTTRIQASLSFEMATMNADIEFTLEFAVGDKLCFRHESQRLRSREDDHIVYQRKSDDISWESHLLANDLQGDSLADAFP